MLSTVPIIFSGHNERAVVAICRFFESIRCKFHIVARHDADAIFQTQWVDHVLLRRPSLNLSVELFAEIYNAVHAMGDVPCICPTSEFLNRFLLDNEDEIRGQGWVWLLPSLDVYIRLSNKDRSPIFIEQLIGMHAPREQKKGHWQAPCVLKPRNNIDNGKVLYPIIVSSKEELDQLLGKIQQYAWFSQQWIEGQSLYLCAYLDQFGDWDAFWQENLLQQPGGKSMVLARTSTNPGVNVTHLMSALHRIGYRGPFMMEILKDSSGDLYFIEVNPRFWGPLDLARRACPSLLKRYFNDMNGLRMPKMEEMDNRVHMYAWAFGAKGGQLKVYPGASSLTHDEIMSLLKEHDVYSYSDTQMLSQQH